MSKQAKFIGKSLLILLTLVGVVTLALLFAREIQNNLELQTFIASLGYGGVVLLGIIAGLNVIIPLPAATFTPAFIAAGLWFPFIIIALGIGTIIADYIGYLFGRWGREGVQAKYPASFERYEKLVTKHHAWLTPVIFLYAAFAPFPNEAIILPLAVLGIRFQYMLLPLLLGNVINQTIFSYGAHNVFLWLF